MDTIGERLRFLRKRLGLSQKEMAQKLGISRVALARYENNKRYPDTAILAKIAQILGVSLDWLVTGKGEMFTSERDELLNELVNELERVRRDYGEDWYQDFVKDFLKSIERVRKATASKGTKMAG